MTSPHGTNPYQQNWGDSELTAPTQAPPPGYGAPTTYGAMAPYGAPAPALSSRSKVAAGILGILLGSLGVHNFYLGRTGRGLAQLLITVLTLGFGAMVTSIWGLIEGILILTSKPPSRWCFDADNQMLQG